MTKKINKIHKKNLKESSRRWLLRQLNDPYVEQAKKLGYRSRAAFKLVEIQKKFDILKKGMLVVDLGSAPGGWSQIASQYVDRIIAIDLLEMEPLKNVEFIRGDFLDNEIYQKLKDILEDGKVDVVMSDMAPSTSGIKKIDHLRIMSLLENVYEFSKEHLKEGGSMIAKVFQGGAQTEFLKELRKHFSKVHHFKPNSSRKESSEMYIIAIGYHD